MGIDRYLYAIKHRKETTMRLTHKLQFQAMGDQYVGVPVGESTNKLEGMLQLNETCYTLISPLLNAKDGEDVTRKQLIDNALEVYDADEETLAEYIDKITNQLKEEGLLE